MKTIKITKELQDRQWGGDLWNESKVARQVADLDPNASKFTYTIGSGLFVTGTVTTKSGETYDAKIFDSVKGYRVNN